MDLQDFHAGIFRKGYQYQYFMPALVDHSFVWRDANINELLERASLKLGELNSFSRFVPDTGMFIRMHVFKEAVKSNRIEGTQTTVEEALIDEDDVAPERRDDWQEVNNYVAAMDAAIRELAEIPLSNRLIRNAHRVILASARGEHKNPGEFRTSQNWIGGASISDAVFIPPHHNEVPGLMADLEKFLHNDANKVPHLVRIAIAHYQFETIHPFLDGNGRVGRLLITLYLVSSGVLDRPLLYLSDFLERNKALYYDHLTDVRTKNDLSRWIRFFLAGVEQTSDSAIQTLQRIVKLKESLEQDIMLTMGKRTKSGMEFLHHLFKRPTVSVKEVQALTGLSSKAANNLVQAFVERGILKETTGRERHRLFAFSEYMRLFH